MLDTTTKKRIDDIRDILVGKVTNPIQQVEQITVALIYKFMDDMDLESVELGGERKFFSHEYEKFAWSNLFRSDIGGEERVELYSEALVKMENNRYLPQLFRNIFKRAFLPYRDAETLRNFLKYINDFNYSHSEKLGDAFEYLLSILGSQGDAGQFRTPRHIIDFMAAMLDPKKGETILDPACGTAGFLISAYKHILKSNSSNYDADKDQHAFEMHGVNLDELTVNGKHYKGDQLTPDERNLLTNNVRGYDISPDMVRLSLVNMYLHGFPEPHIYEYDTLTSDDRWNEYYDVILANPPFMSPKGGIRPHKRFSVQSKRSEVLFVDYMVEHLTAKGRAAIVVPEGIIFQTGTAYKSLRKMLVDENYLVGVISIPAGVFNPYSGVKTSILWLDKKLAKKTGNILFAKITNDGFDLGAQRRSIKLNDLPDAFRKITLYRDALMHDKKVDFEDDPIASVISKKEILGVGDYNLSGERYKSIDVANTIYPLNKLEDLFEIQRGGSPRPIQDYITESTDGLNWIKIGDGKEGTKYITETKQKIKPEGLKKSRLVEPGDFILSNSMSYGRPFIMKITGCIHDGWLVFKQKSEIVNKDYIYSILLSDQVKAQFEKSATGGVVKNLNINLVKQVEIPFPPLSVQEEIVTEIVGYQKIIDGARQVVDNYKPHIDIDPDWDMVELGEVIESLETGVSVNSENKKIKDGEKGVLKTSAVTYGIFRPEEHKMILPAEIIRARCNPKKDSIIISRMNTEQLVGANAYVDKDYENLFLPDRLWQTVISKSNVSVRFIHLVISSDEYRKKISDVCGGTSGSMKNISKKNFLSIYVPIPNIETQQQIVTRIEQEQQLVNANKQLIEIYEQKIKDRIGKVWGGVTELSI